MQRGCTALIRAAQFGHAECVELLVNGGADKEAKDEVRVFVLWNCIVFEHVAILFAPS